MSGDQHISNRLVSAVSGGDLETARELINSFGLSYSKAWSDGYALLLNAAMTNRTAVAELLLTSGSPVNSSHYKLTDTPLHFAAAHGNIVIVKMLLNKGANINAKNEYGKTPLFNVIDMVDIDYEYKDKLEVIELLLKKKADVNASDKYGTSPLHIAVKSRCLKIVKFLLEYEVDVNCAMYAAKLNKNYTPLHYAVEYNLKEATSLLLSRGANVNVRAANNITPLHIAIKKGYTHIAEELLNNGACINCSTLIEECTPLHFACEGYMGSLHTSERSNFEKTVKLLLNRGADVDVKGKHGITPLHIAVEKGYTYIAEELLSHGASINSSTLKEGFTPLHIACKQGSEEIVKILLNRDADVNAISTKNNLTPLHFAIKRQNTAILRLLLQHGAKVDNEDKDGKTVLHLAVETGDLKIVKDVLKYCPDVNNQSNRSSLKTAVYGYGKENIVPALLEYGLHFNSDDTKNAELLHVAVQKGHLQTVEDLLKNGADVDALIQNSTYGNGFTPLHSAANYKHKKIPKLLMNYESGKTPIFYAIQNMDLKMIKLLLTYKANVNDRPELLHNAVKKENIEIVEALSQHDHVDVNASDAFGRTALYFTSIKSCPSISSNPDIKGKIAELLLSQGANVNAQTKDGQTALNSAIKNEYVKVVQALLKYNPNLNSAVTSDDLPLHLSVQRRHTKFITMLLKKGANVNAKQTNGMTALHIATLEAYQPIIKLLLKYGSDINAQDYWGRTPLHLASKARNKYIVETLLNYGSDINVLSTDDQTPFDIALQKSTKKKLCCDHYNDYDYDFNNDHYNDYDYDFNNDHSNDYDYDSDDDYPLEEVGEILGYHILKMKIANLYVNEENSFALNLVADKIYFEVECAEEEIEEMKREKINNANISFYDILARNSSSLANYMRNENVVQILESDDYKSKFPIYTSMIKSYFRKAMKRKELLDQVNEIIYFVFNNLPELPYDCIDKILSHVSDEDLRIIMDACNKPFSISNPYP